MKIRVRSGALETKVDGAPEGQDDSRRYRVELDGVDVSRNCLMADNLEGEVEVYHLDEAGAYHTGEDGESIAREIKRGQVAIFYDGQAV